MSIAVVLLGGRVPSITDSTGKAAPATVSLDLPSSYVAMSPVSRTLDALTLLSTAQTISAFALVAILFLASIAFSRRTVKRGWRSWTMRIAGMIVAIAVVEAAVALAPRPMARLRVDDPEIVVADFHSHTGSSHDVRKSFKAEDNREWHASGGFDIAWITDHVKFDGAVAARARNPQVAGSGVSLLTGVEGRYHKIMSTIMLGLDERDTALLNKRGNLLPGTPARGVGPVTIVALPNRNLDSVTVESLDSANRFTAIELIDAAPRGLSQFDREEGRVRELASRLRLSLVAASNNHGYGRTVAAWNLARVPGWRMLTPDSVGRLIEQPLRNRDMNAVTIVMRTRPRTHDASLPLTLPVMAYQIIGGLTPLERVSWLLWIAAITLAAFLVRRQKRQ